MTPLRRYETIMETLLAQREVTVNGLSERLQVTGKTIRKDLAELEEKGLLVRVHGGAILAQNDDLGILSAKESAVPHAQERAEVAARAIRYIQPNDIIALDGGRTTLAIARKLDNQPLTVVTNDLNIICELANKEKIRLVVPGGYRVRNMFTGSEAVDYIKSLNIDKAFLSAASVQLESGFSIYTADFIELKRAYLQTAKKTYVVADHHKFDRSALRTFASFQEIKTIITDSAILPETVDQFRWAGIEVDYEK